MQFINPTDRIVIVAIKQGRAPCITVDPGEVVDLPDWACAPRRNPNGSRRHSVIEDIAPQLKPANEEELAEWLLTPPPETGKQGRYVPSYAELVRQGTAPAMARKMVEAAAASLVEEAKLAEKFETDRVKARSKAKREG